jgi:hypothetical protein
MIGLYKKISYGRKWPANSGGGSNWWLVEDSGELHQ